ncbi:MAG: hypothetical protein L3J37_10855 [Rhodobacteraceae bacterium]|nr:hypothetical protein [Paracoccaceae bacterium]
MKEYKEGWNAVAHDKLNGGSIIIFTHKFFLLVYWKPTGKSLRISGANSPAWEEMA